MAKLRIQRTITLTCWITVDENTYQKDDGSTMTPQEARDYEYDKELVDKLEMFAELLQDASFSLDTPAGYTQGRISDEITVEE